MRIGSPIGSYMNSLGSDVFVGTLRVVQTSRHLVEAPSACCRKDGSGFVVTFELLKAAEPNPKECHPPLYLLGPFLDWNLLDVGLAPQGHFPSLRKAKEPARTSSKRFRHHSSLVGEGIVLSYLVHLAPHQAPEVLGSDLPALLAKLLELVEDYLFLHSEHTLLVAHPCEMPPLVAPVGAPMLIDGCLPFHPNIHLVLGDVVQVGDDRGHMMSIVGQLLAVPLVVLDDLDLECIRSTPSICDTLIALAPILMEPGWSSSLRHCCRDEIADDECDVHIACTISLPVGHIKVSAGASTSTWTSHLSVVFALSSGDITRMNMAATDCKFVDVLDEWLYFWCRARGPGFVVTKLQ